MSLLFIALRILALAGGAALSLLFTILLAGRRPRRWAPLAVFGAAALWHWALLGEALAQAALSGPYGVAAVLADLALRVGMAAGAVWALAERRWRWVGLGLALVPWPSVLALPFVTFGLLAGVAVAAQRTGWLGLHISRRVRMVAALAGSSTIYLLLVRRIADYLTREFDAFGELLEVVLIFGAAVGWFGLYSWMTRAMSRRTAVYAAFGKRVMEEAVPILDLRERVQFLAGEVGKTFALRRVRIRVDGPPALEGRYGNVDPDDGVYAYRFSLRYQDSVLGELLADCRPRVTLDEDETILQELSRQIAHSIEACRLADEKLALERTLLEQEQLATMGTLAATIAHEVKNPLGPMKTLAQVMMEDPALPESFHKDLEIMLSEIDRLNRCVQQLLSFARPVAAGDARIDVAEMIDTTIRLLRREAGPRNVTLRGEVSTGLSIYGKDRQGVQQILLNLALNAIQASGVGGAVTLEAAGGADGRMVLTVTDEGPGIPAAMQKRVFEPFFTTKQQGTGLGLAIVKKNVRQLGGELALESPVRDGAGTRVRVTLG